MNFHPRLVSLSNILTLDRPSHLGGLIIASPVRGADDTFLWDAFKVAQYASCGLRRTGKEGGSFFITISRLDGAFGIDGFNDAIAPESGGLAGLSKTAHHEWPEVSCRALDLDIAANLEIDGQKTSAIIDEILHRGPIEVGLSKRGFCTLHLSETLLPSKNGKQPLNEEDVIVISGGGRGVTAEVAVALAETFRPKLVLFGRSPEPTEEPDWLSSLSDEAEIKRAIFDQAEGASLTPKAIAEKYRKISANRQIGRTLERIKAAGASVIYQSVDVRDVAAVETVLQDVRQNIGPITGLIHGAGVLADQRIEDKTEEQFKDVYSTKVLGLKSLLKSLNHDELKIFVLFSSSTARFGRVGQVDYAMANEVLNKMAQKHASKFPSCRVLAMNWGPWKGGMVTDELKKIFEKEGVGLIPTKKGAEYLTQELEAHVDSAVEVVLTGPSPQTLQLAFEHTLDVEHHNFLRSHVIDGHAVFPMAMVIEWLAHGALQNNPGLVFHGFKDLRILKGLTLFDGQPCPTSVFVGKEKTVGVTTIVPVELRSYGSNGGTGIHARAEILLTKRLIRNERQSGNGGNKAFKTEPYPRGNGEIYQDYLFHGPDLQGIQEIKGFSAEGIIATAKTSPSPNHWMEYPVNSSWLADPLALDSGCQMMTLWSLERHQAASLPCFVQSYRQFRKTFPKGGVRISAHVTNDTDHHAVADIEFLDQNNHLIAVMQGYECTIDRSLNHAFRRNQLTHHTSLQTDTSKHAR